MIEWVWRNIFEFKEFICVSGGAIIVIALVIPALLRRFDWKRGRGTLPYLLFAMNARAVLMFSLTVMEILFVLCTILFRKDIHYGYGVAFLVLWAAYALLCPRLRFVVTEAMHSLLLWAALLCGNIMYRYLMEIRMEGSVFAIYLLLNIFMICHVCYVGLGHLLQLNEKEGWFYEKNMEKHKYKE